MELFRLQLELFGLREALFTLRLELFALRERLFGLGERFSPLLADLRVPQEQLTSLLRSQESFHL
jgi:hypothetical protein